MGKKLENKNKMLHEKKASHRSIHECTHKA